MSRIASHTSISPNTRKTIVFALLLLVVAMLSSSFVSAALGDRLSALQHKVFSVNTLHGIINALVIFLVLFIIQSFMFKDMPDAQKKILFVILMIVCLFISFKFFTADYVWKFAKISAVLHWKVMVNFIVIYAGLYLINALILRDKLGSSKEVKTGSVLLIIILAIMITYAPIKADDNPEGAGNYPGDDHYPLVWQKDGMLNGLFVYLFDKGTGILRGEHLAVFIGSIVLFYWLFSGVAAITDSKTITGAISVTMAAGVSHSQISFASFAYVAQWVAILLLYAQFTSKGQFKIDANFEGKEWVQHGLRILIALLLVLLLANIVWHNHAIVKIDFLGASGGGVSVTNGAQTEALIQNAQPPSVSSVNTAGFNPLGGLPWWLQIIVYLGLLVTVVLLFFFKSWKMKIVIVAVIILSSSFLKLPFKPIFWLLKILPGWWKLVVPAVILYFLVPRLITTSLKYTRANLHIRHFGFYKWESFLGWMKSRRGLWGWIGKRYRHAARESRVEGELPPVVRRLNVELTTYLNYMLRLQVFRNKGATVTKETKTMKATRGEKGGDDKFNYARLGPEDTKERLLTRIVSIFSGTSFETVPGPVNDLDVDGKPIRLIRMRPEDYSHDKYDQNTKGVTLISSGRWEMGRPGLADSSQPIRDLFDILKQELEKSDPPPGKIGRPDIFSSDRVVPLINKRADRMKEFEQSILQMGTYNFIESDAVERFDNYTMDGMWARTYKYAKPTAIVEIYKAKLNAKKKYPAREFDVLERVGPSYLERLTIIERNIRSRRKLDNDATITRRMIEDELRDHPADYQNWTAGTHQGTYYPFEIDHHGWVVMDKSHLKMIKDLGDDLSVHRLFNLPGGIPELKSSDEFYIRRVRGTDWLSMGKHTQVYNIRHDTSYQYLEKEWEAFNEDMLKGVYHPNSVTYQDYHHYLMEYQFDMLNMVRGYGSLSNAEMKELQRTNKLSHGHGGERNPETSQTFDMEAFKSPDDLHFWGRKYYWDFDKPHTINTHENTKPHNPWPGVSIEGMRLFLTTYIDKKSKEEGYNLDQVYQEYLFEMRRGSHHE